MVDTKKLYKYYLKRINKYSVEFPCLVCEEKKKPRELKQHFEVFHRSFKNTCCWCLNYTWKPKEKTQHAQHLFHCFTQFLLKFHKGGSRIVQLNTFHSNLAKMSDCLMLCPWQNFSCRTLVKPGEMERHFKMEHKPFDPTLSCIWCDGAVSWLRNRKSLSIDHILSCFENYCRKEKELATKESSPAEMLEEISFEEVWNELLGENNAEWKDVLSKNNAQWEDVLSKNNEQWKAFLDKNNAEWKVFLARNNEHWQEILAQKDKEWESNLKVLKKDYEWLQYKYPLND